MKSEFHPNMRIIDHGVLCMQRMSFDYVLVCEPHSGCKLDITNILQDLVTHSETNNGLGLSVFLFPSRYEEAKGVSCSERYPVP